jgi:hypothetical protein
MLESLQDLESRPAALAKQFAHLGDLRSGSISNTSGRCGAINPASQRMVPTRD